jgi:hypothetical protein
MDKISNAQIAEVMHDAAATLREKQARIVDLEEKLASKERRERVEKLAAAMHGKGLELDTSIADLADRYEKTASDKLSAIEHAVDIVGPDMGLKLAQVNNDEPGTSSAGSSDFERFIAGSVG